MQVIIFFHFNDQTLLDNSDLKKKNYLLNNTIHFGNFVY